ncbi:MAG: hypothetical protein AB2L09_05305 [Coriobacteriia bacterium]
MADTGAPQPKSNRWHESATVLGPAFYWAWCLLLFSGIESAFHAEAPSSYPGTVAAVLFVVAVTGASRFFVKPGNRRLLLVTVPFATFGLVGSSLITDVSLDHRLIILISICRGLGLSGSALLWGLWFALMDARTVLPAVTKTTVLAIGMFLALVAMPTGVTFVVGGLLPIVSGIAFLLSPQAPSGHIPKADARPARRVFYSERLAFGLALGLVGSVVALGHTESVQSSATPLTVLFAGIAAVVLFLGLVIPLRGRALDVKYLPALPLLASGLLLVPFLGADSRLILQIAYASGWLCWMIMAAIQLSAIKIRLGLDETTVAFGQTCCHICLVGGIALGRGNHRVDGDSLGSICDDRCHRFRVSSHTCRDTVPCRVFREK